MTDKQIRQLADKAWQEAWSDHLRNQEDCEINKRSFYLGFLKCGDYLSEIVKALEFECGNRCSRQNPCSAKDALDALKEGLE